MWVCYFLFLSFSPMCFALEQKYPAIKGETINANTDLPGAINYFFNFGIMGGGLAAMFAITFAGFRWTSSAASAHEKQAAMEQIKAGLFGLLLLLASFLLLQMINPDLVNLQMPTLTK